MAEVSTVLRTTVPAATRLRARNCGPFEVTPTTVTGAGPAVHWIATRMPLACSRTGVTAAPAGKVS
jgi:hypothetical protein